MRYVFLILLAGCSTTFDVSRLEPGCARSCLADNSLCASNTRVGHRGQCNANTESCLSTCPAVR